MNKTKTDDQVNGNLLGAPFGVLPSLILKKKSTVTRMPNQSVPSWHKGISGQGPPGGTYK